MTLVARMHYEIPDDLHRRAKAAAAMQGITLKEFVIQALEEATGAGKGPKPKSRPKE